MPELKVIQPAAATPPKPGSRWKSLAMRLYRLGVVVAIVWLVHANAVRAKVLGDAPVKLEEVRQLLPATTKLEPDPSERLGLFALDAGGQRVGYALRTSPQADKITGYVGSTDTLIVLDATMKVVGIRIRSTHDTKEHVFEKVAVDDNYMTKWNGMGWDQVAAYEPRVGYDDVAGASLSSMAIANGITHRFRVAEEAAAAPPPAVRFGWNNAGLVAVLAVAVAFAFSSRLRGKPWARRAFQVVLVGYVGFANGQILSQSLMSGWAVAGVPWRLAPGLALLLAAALVVPWTTRRQLYCSQICPHGAAQELAGRLSKRKLHLPGSVDRGLRWLPPLLVVLVLIVTMFELPIDRADVEPFVAYQVWLASGVAIAIAVGGLLAAVFVPMAYCKYGCPTGLVLSFVRSHGRADGFGRRDLAAGLLVLGVLVLYLRYDQVRWWIYG
jgi:NosR/NirI family nitrous oxide reductase transcriptional regulator